MYAPRPCPAEFSSSNDMVISLCLCQNPVPGDSFGVILATEFTNADSQDSAELALGQAGKQFSPHEFHLAAGFATGNHVRKAAVAPSPNWVHLQ